MRCFSSAGSPLQAYVFSLGYPSIHDSPIQASRASSTFGLDRLLCAHTARAQKLLSLESHLWRGGFPHSDICGSKLVCQLPAAFRRLPRPSSPVIAKASTACTYSLDPITVSTLHLLCFMPSGYRLSRACSVVRTALAFCLESRHVDTII
jgi:hypothetical protein